MTRVIPGIATKHNIQQSTAVEYYVEFLSNLLYIGNRISDTYNIPVVIVGTLL